MRFNYIGSTITFLKGKKTYILATLGALVVFVKFLGWIDEATANTLLGLLGFGAFATLRAGGKK